MQDLLHPDTQVNTIPRGILCFHQSRKFGEFDDSTNGGPANREPLSNLRIPKSKLTLNQ